MIVVTGATGRLGQLVIDGLLPQVPPAQIVAAVRTPAKAGSLAARGVTVRAADYNEPEQLRAAFTGADRVLLISSNDPRQSVTQHTAVIEAARQAGAGLLAYTSLWHADTSTLLTAVPHRLTEPIIRDSGVPYTFLRNNLYTEHYAPQIRQAVTSGTFVGSAGTGRVASATRADYAAAAVAVLTGHGHENKVYELGGDVAWSYAELAAVLSSSPGRGSRTRASPRRSTTSCCWPQDYRAWPPTCSWTPTPASPTGNSLIRQETSGPSSAARPPRWPTQ